MAKLYGKLKTTIARSESKPKVKLTEQRWTEAVLTLPCIVEGIPIWKGLIVPFDTYIALRNKSIQSPINLIKIGRFVNYRDDQDRLLSLNGWGVSPLKAMKVWIDGQYDFPSIDETIDLTYNNDDIRLCTIQRSSAKQLIGIRFCYFRQDQFHYIRSSYNYVSTLAYRAGLRNFDRIISINRTNIEQDTPKQRADRWKKQRHLPLQMLVCSPATYAHYKSHNIPLHEDLPTVQHLRPVFDISPKTINVDKETISVFNEKFCVVQWEECKTINTVPQSSVFKSPEFTRINDICFIEIEEQYRKGRILFIGSYGDCESVSSINDSEKFLTGITQTHGPQQNANNNPAAENETSDNQYMNECDSTVLEELPNELLLNIFNYIESSNLYGAFWDLNCRFNNLLLSCSNLFLTLDENKDPLLMKTYASQVVGLAVDTSDVYDFQQFPNLRGLTFYNRNPGHLAQIQPDIVPNLTHLSLLLESDFAPSSQLLNYVFSNRFPFLRYANLGRVEEQIHTSWSTSPSLRFVSISSAQPTTLVQTILVSCPNLYHLRLHVLSGSLILLIKSSTINHPLQRLTLWSDNAILTSQIIDALLIHTTNLRYLYLQTICRTPFVSLANYLLDRLHHLFRFDCYVKEIMDTGIRVGDLSVLHQLHPCFNGVRCVTETDKFRVFATD